MNEQGSGLGAGVRIGEYEIVRELGFGGFGITYLARDRVLERLVAVKEYFPADWGTRRTDGTIGPRTTGAARDYAWGLERFVDEARALARLDHPAVVKVHRVVEAGGTAYMVMEYVEGRSLAEELQVSGPLPDARVRGLLSGLAEGLGAVHAAGLVHRDIKPANVMLRSRDGSPVLIDFGAAREHMGRQSRSITAVLTPGYAPIEQYSAKGRQGPWTDVYALGALAYAALSGRAPDDASERMLEDRLVPVAAASATPVSGGLARAVEAALAVDMRQRPQDTGQWLALLGEGGAGTAGEAIAAAAEVEAGSQGWTAGTGKSPVPAGEEAVAPASGGPGRRTRRRVWPLGVGGAAAVVLGVVAFAVLGRGGDPVADWESEEVGLGLGVEDRVLVQRGLLELGYDPGEGDGLLSTGTRSALREWQTARDLEPTGYLTAAMAEVLRAVGEQAVADSMVAIAEEAQRVSDSIAEADAEAEEQRLAAERAEAARQAEEQRLAAERAEAARQAEERAEAVRRVEEQRLAVGRRRPEPVFRDCGTCPEMVVVPAGSFMMGSPYSGSIFHNNQPRHRVTIGYTFAVGVYEVTFAEWDACVRAGGCGGYRPDDDGWGRGSRPVIDVSWDDAQEYVRWLSRETGESYRLLSESEWEYVARAGTTTARYWGVSESGQCRYANGFDGLVDCSDGYEYTAPVGMFGANAFGLHDVLGNVSEWTQDCRNSDGGRITYLGAPVNGSAWTSRDCAERAARGGHWFSHPDWIRSAYRQWFSAGDRSSNRGFRVAWTMN